MRAEAAFADTDNDSRLGEFTDRNTLRFVRDFPHPAEFVWATLTDAGQFATWLWPCRRLEARLGGAFEFDISGQAWIGEVTAFDPPRRLDLGGHLRFDLASHGAGSRLIVTVRRPPTGWSVMALAGFHGWLGRLTRLLAGTPQAETEAWAAEIWQSVFAAYELLVRLHVAGGARVLWRAHFAANDAGLDGEAEGLLEELSGVLEGRPDLSVTIDGFGDDPCPYDESLELCRRRVEATRAALTALGIAPDRVHTGFVLGNYHYLVERGNAAGRAFNRRLELRLGY